MKRSKKPARHDRPGQCRRSSISVSAAEFKATCLSLMDEVRNQGTEVIITKHRRPIARLVPVEKPAARPFVNRTAGFFDTRGDLIAPLAPDWEVDADL